MPLGALGKQEIINKIQFLVLISTKHTRKPFCHDLEGLCEKGTKLLIDIPALCRHMLDLEDAGNNKSNSSNIQSLLSTYYKPSNTLGFLYLSVQPLRQECLLSLFYRERN